MGIRYFRTANTDITGSPGWLKRLLTLGLLYLIPVFGAVVLNGYLYGWAREAVWGTCRPLPQRVLGNEDGQLYRRGWRVFVVQLVYMLLPILMAAIATGAFFGMIFYAIADFPDGASAMLGFLGGYLLVTLIVILLMLVLSFFAWAGSIRSAVYGNIRSGLRFGEVFGMLRRDFGGILRIFGMSLLVSLISSVILQVALSFVYSLIGFFGGMLAASIAESTMMDVRAIWPLLLLGILILMMPGYYVNFVLVSYQSALVTRALGYWARGVLPDSWQTSASEGNAWAAAPPQPAPQPQPGYDPAPAPQPGCVPAPAPPSDTAPPQPAPNPPSSPGDTL